MDKQSLMEAFIAFNPELYDNTIGRPPNASANTGATTRSADVGEVKMLSYSKAPVVVDAPNEKQGRESKTSFFNL